MILINNEKYYKPTEVAKMFSVSISTVARWRSEGRLKGNKVNERKYLYGEHDIERFIKGDICPAESTN